MLGGARVAVVDPVRCWKTGICKPWYTELALAGEGRCSAKEDSVVGKAFWRC